MALITEQGRKWLREQRAIVQKLDNSAASTGLNHGNVNHGNVKNAETDRGVVV